MINFKTQLTKKTIDVIINNAFKKQTKTTKLYDFAKEFVESAEILKKEVKRYTDKILQTTDCEDIAKQINNVKIHLPNCDIYGDGFNNYSLLFNLSITEGQVFLNVILTNKDEKNHPITLLHEIYSNDLIDYLFYFENENKKKLEKERLTISLSSLKQLGYKFKYFDDNKNELKLALEDDEIIIIYHDKMESATMYNIKNLHDYEVFDISKDAFRGLVSGYFLMDDEA